MNSNNKYIDCFNKFTRYFNQTSNDFVTMFNKCIEVSQEFNSIFNEVIWHFYPKTKGEVLCWWMLKHPYLQMRNEYKIFEKIDNIKPEENHLNQELCGFFIKNNYQLK